YVRNRHSTDTSTTGGPPKTTLRESNAFDARGRANTPHHHPPSHHHPLPQFRETIPALLCLLEASSVHPVPAEAELANKRQWIRSCSKMKACVIAFARPRSSSTQVCFCSALPFLRHDGC